LRIPQTRYLLKSFFANFLERRQSEVRRTSLLLSPDRG
jgi:hypothetical protein